MNLGEPKNVKKPTISLLVLALIRHQEDLLLGLLQQSEDILPIVSSNAYNW